MSISFKTTNTTLVDSPLKTTKAHKAIEDMVGRPIQSCSNYHTDVVTCGYHAVIKAAELCFRLHRPLVLSPDSIWLTIAQGIAQHISLNAEKLRKHFVSHQGKAEIVVRRDNFIFGSPENTWEDVFDEFSVKIKEYIGDKHGILISDFSTTGKVEKAASEITLMDCMKSYFSYTVMTMCGIPEVKLTGTTEDWEKIAEKFEKCREFLPEWWVDTIRPVCREFINASEGNINDDWWKDIYNEEGGSGGPFITGWLRKLVPYIRHYHGKPCNIQNNKNKGWGGGGITADQLPSSLCETDFKWNYYGRSRRRRRQDGTRRRGR